MKGVCWRIMSPCCYDVVTMRSYISVSNWYDRTRSLPLESRRTEYLKDSLSVLVRRFADEIIRSNQLFTFLTVFDSS